MRAVVIVLQLSCLAACASVQAGLREGLELHLIGLTAGVGLWPPSIKLPFLPALPWGLVGRGRAPLPPADTGS